MFRVLLLVHRYLGIALGVLVSLWCLSAFVMMYVQFPDLSEKEYLAGLPGLDVSECCQLDIDDAEFLLHVDEIEVEMFGDVPVLRVQGEMRDSRVFNLADGSQITLIDVATAQGNAQAFFENSGISATAIFLGEVNRDQWTVSGGFDALRPFYKFAAEDDAGSQIYVSSVTGELVQDTSRRERFWNWTGAVVHWIYPTVLRQHTTAWINVIIWTTVASLFLVIVGFYIGVSQLGRNNNGRASPYRGITLWHHYISLIFGLLTLTWLVSGLFSVNPWGLLRGDGGAVERGAVRGMSISSIDITGLLNMLPDAVLPPDTVRLRSAPFDGELAVLAYDSTSRVTRLNATTLERGSLPEDVWKKLPQLLRPETAVLDSGWIDQADSYYFSHHDKVTFPAYRIVFDDEEQTRYYFEADGGQLVAKVDRNRRWYRWILHALHRGDLSRLIRSRPLWDILMLPLLFGVTMGALTGAYMGIRRLVR